MWGQESQVYLKTTSVLPPVIRARFVELETKLEEQFVNTTRWTQDVYI